MKLVNYAKDVYSRFGEDGIIEHIFDVIGTQFKVCVEFGAGESTEDSLVAALWKHNWVAYLLESDAQRAEALRNVVNKNCFVFQREVRISGNHSIDNILGKRDIDLMVIDVDGNDYLIWESMELTPRVIGIEFNPTVPPHISLHQEYDTKMSFGASLLALIELGNQKGYLFVGATYCNAFFVRDDLAEPFISYERDPKKLFPLENYTFLVTDFTGHAMATGKKQFWGYKTPYVGPNLVGDYAPILSKFIKAEQTMDAYEETYGEGVRWLDRPNICNPDESPTYTPNARDTLLSYLKKTVSPICIDVTHISSNEAIEWVYTLATEYRYDCRLGGDVLALIRSES